MDENRSENRSAYKIVVLGFMLGLCLLAIYYFHFVLEAEIVFTHLFYVPIILASLWWSRKGLLVAVFLAVLLLVSHVLSPLDSPVGADIARATMFVVVGAVVGILNERQLILGAKLRAYSKTLEQRVDERTNALREAQEKQRAILDGIGDAVIVLDGDLNITWANPLAVERYGTILGKKCYQAVKWLEKPCAGCVARKVLADGVAGSLEEEGVLKDGTRISFVVSCSPMRDTEGKIMAVVEVFHDITERMQAEEALRESEEQLQTLIDAMPDFVCFKDGDGRWLKVNAASVRLFRLEGLDYQGKRNSELAELSNYLRGTFLTCEKTDAETWKKQGLSRGEETIFQPDGTVRIYDVIKMPVFYPDGKRKALVILGRDVTERVQAEEERECLLAQVREQAHQVQQIIATVPEGVLLLDAAGQVVLANPVAERDLVVLANARVGDILTRLGDQPLAELLTSPPTKGLWHEVRVGQRIFEIIARPVENGPEPQGWVLVIRDVTREREIQQHVRQQEQLAAVGQLAAGIAHDFNNIMTIIVLYTQMGLGLPDLSPKLRERLGIVVRQANRATHLIQQLLDFSRRAVLERLPMDLTPFLKEQVKMLERALPENIEIGLTYGTDDYTVNADPTRMQQIALNLALNARDAMLPQGGGKLHIALSRIAATDEKGERVRIAVSDTGGGISPEVLPHIFEPFFTTKEVGRGTGLGLAQVAGIVAQHEGHIDVTTKMGEGTTFTIYLPALLGQQPEALALKTQAFAQGRGEVLLLVEDNAALREALADSLELLNYRVLKAANGREALAIMEQHEDEIALVLTDVVMPEMGGQALFRSLRQRGLTLPVVMLTGHPMENELESLKAQGLAGWMFKPPDMEQLAELLARVLQKS